MIMDNIAKNKIIKGGIFQGAKGHRGRDQGEERGRVNFSVNGFREIRFRSVDDIKSVKVGRKT